ncbi:Cytosolic sulfotransferase 15 [Bienertia sinuspersici]
MSDDLSQHPFHTKNPHQLIPQFEFDVYKKISGDQPNLSHMPPPRIFGSHIPYPSLPESIKNSKCRMVYICRNPFDTFISSWHFLLKFDSNKGFKPNMEMMEKHVDKFCKGEYVFGPYEDHLLGYLKESRQNPLKVLFLEYEGLKNDPKTHLKKLAEFVGYPFSEEEEKRGVIDDIIKLCSLKSMKEMEVNKSGKYVPEFENNAYFRKGEVGDWINYLTPSMAKRIEDMQEKLTTKTGFSFTYYPARKT